MKQPLIKHWNTFFVQRKTDGKEKSEVITFSRISTARASMKYDRNIYYLEIPHCYSLKKKYKFEWSKLFFGEMNYHTRSLFYILSRWWDTWFRNKMIPAFLILYDGKKYYSQEVSIANCKKIGRVKQGQRKKRIRTHLLKE